nr:hypothetical protein [Candidatus Gracilibacteria bacterium]
MKTLIIGVGAFGFAILKHLSEKNNNDVFYAYEKNDLVINYLKNFRKHPYFFDGFKLGENILFVDKLEEILPNIDLLILALPCQLVPPFIESIKGYLKPGLTILNLAKGINNKTLNTIGDDLNNILTGISYNYAVLSGGMIAEDVVKGNIIGASVGVESEALGNMLKSYFETPKFKVSLWLGNVKNAELAGALKNIFAIFSGYNEGFGSGSSSLGYFFCQYYKEFKKLFILLGGSDSIEFERFAIGGDLIATCFGNSRNRYFGRLIGEGRTTKETLDILASEKKMAEGYETLKGVYEIIKDRDDFSITKELGKKILFSN